MGNEFNSLNNADFDLKAFRYIAGEMLADEFSQFEERLAVDQDARDAVARSVQIAHAVAALPPDSTRALATRRTLTNRRAVVALTATAMCLALTVGLLTFGHRNVHQPPSELVSRQAEHLVDLWNQTEVAANRLANGDTAELLNGNPIEVRAAEITVPDWMIVAVAVEYDRVDAPSSENEPQEN